jgi:hypothetical protein
LPISFVWLNVSVVHTLRTCDHAQHFAVASYQGLIEIVTVKA